MVTVDAKYTLHALDGSSRSHDNPFVGTWKLVSCNAYRRSGRVIPLYGPTPDGRLFYDAAGNMSVHIMQAGRPVFVDGHKSRGTSDEMRAAYQGYEAYFATYEVNWERGVISHHVLGGMFPNWTGTEQPRFYYFDGSNRLVLSTEPLGSAPTHRTIIMVVWDRLA